MADTEMLGGPEAIQRFAENEERIDTWVNRPGGYETNTEPPARVESIQDIMQRLNNDAGGVIAQAQGYAEQAGTEADRSKTEADRAEAAADSFDTENLLRKDDKTGVRNAAGLPQATSADEGKALRVGANGDFVTTGEDGYPFIHASAVRNKITAARHNSDGYPDFLIPGYGVFADMEQDGVSGYGYNSMVSASSVYGAANPPSAPLQNQIALAQNGGWLTAAGTTDGSWMLDIDEDIIPVKMEIVWRGLTSGSNQATPQVVQVHGHVRGAAYEDRILLLEVQDNKKFGPNNTTNVGQEYARQYWFTGNRAAFARLEVYVAAPYGMNYTGDILSIRFFGLPDGTPVADKFDVVLYAAPDEPFTATMAMGQTGDDDVKLTSPVVLSGIFNEMCRNHLYIVPPVAGTSPPVPPDYVNSSRAVYVPEMEAFVVADHRKVLYGTEREIARRTLLCWQCEETVDRTVTGGENLIGYNRHGRRTAYAAANLDVHTAEQPRGASASYFFNASSYIAPNANPESQFKDPVAQWILGSQDFTLELDFKYAGQTETAADSICTLFDAGLSGSNSLLLRYYHRRKQLAAYMQGREAFIWPYAADGEWHTLSLSRRADKIFLHIDGKCIAPYDACPAIRKEHPRFMLGRRYGGGDPWRGWLNNFHLVLGDCLHQSEDYIVPATFQKSAIPDKTLWWDAETGIIKEWQAYTGTWIDAPMLPIGHVDTGWTEHVHTEARRGTQRNYDMQKVVSGSYYATGQYDGNYPPGGLFNFAMGGQYIYLTPGGTANNTNDYYVQFELEEAARFSELRLIGGELAWNSSPTIFLWQGSNNGSEWTTLIDRHQFANDGAVNSGTKHYLGNVHNINSMKKVPYTNSAAFKYYRLTLLAKGSIAFYAGIYTTARLQLPLFGGQPEITACTSYIAGEAFKINAMLKPGTFTFEVPFGGAPFDFEGYIAEDGNFTSRRRRINHGYYYWANGNVYSGESEFIGDDEIVMVMPGVTSNAFKEDGVPNSSFGDLELYCRRRR